MTHFRRKRDWELPEGQVTPERVYWRRRDFLKILGAATIGTAGVGLTSLARAGNPMMDEIAALPRLDVPKNEMYQVPGELSQESVAARYNNFYEFSRQKDDVWENARDFKPQPWKVEVGGMVHKPRTYDVDDLVKRMPLEERIYRFRCVEAWSMVVPWIGFPLKALLDEVQPTAISVNSFVASGIVSPSV